MSLGEAFEDAAAILTLIGFLAVGLMVLVFVTSVNNPDANTIVQFKNIVIALVNVLIPILGGLSYLA